VYFGFTDDQLAFRDAVRDLLRDACSAADVRAAWLEGPGYDHKLWAALAEMGVLGLLAPEAAGGLGLSDVELVLILEETGRAAMPGPIVEHAAVGVPVLAAAGAPDLDAAAAGQTLVTCSDRVDRVPWGAEADVVLLADDGEVARASVDVLSPLPCVDHSRREVAVRVASRTTLTADASLARDRGALGTAAQLCGLAAHLIAMTADYVRERKQFGVPVGSYQAVKHHLANALLRLEHARPPVYRAAWSVSTGAATRGRDVAMAKAMAGDAAALAGRVALQCHGAIGYTWEHDLHLWLKRVWVLEQAWGDSAQHRATVADAVLS
jgi:alkylation response protein AidB-like acyl-CoA dehydrogenase